MTLNRSPSSQRIELPALTC